MPGLSQDDYIRTLDCALKGGQPAPERAGRMFHVKG